jgi:hypothetical protein
MSSSQFGDMLISRGQAAAAIHHDDRCVRFLERSHGLLDHELVDADLTARNPARIDDQVRDRSKLAETVLSVAGQAGIVGNQRISGTGQSIEQRRLADIGSTNERYNGKHRSTLEFRRQAPSSAMSGALRCRFGGGTAYAASVPESLCTYSLSATTTGSAEIAALPNRRRATGSPSTLLKKCR